MYQALYRKYRPSCFEDVVGQKIIIKTLLNSFKQNKINHAYLFSGPRGTGKTSAARIFAELINCEKPLENKKCGKCDFCTQKEKMDIIEIDAASNNGVDEIREINNKVSLVPTLGKYKIYIIDEVHMLSSGAFNALLKTLEEPPKHIVFILATTDPNKIPQTILSRCQRFEFKKIGNLDIFDKLKYIAKKENITIGDEAIKEIALYSEGGLRDAIGILDQISSYCDGKIEIDNVQEVCGLIDKREISDLISNLYNLNVTDVLNCLDSYENKGKNFIKIIEKIILFFRNCLIYQISVDYFNKNVEDSEYYKKISTMLTNEELFICIETFEKTLLESKINKNYKLMFEISCFKLMNLLKNKNSKVIIKEKSFSKKEKEKISVLPIVDNKNEIIEKEDMNLLKEFRIKNTLSRFEKKRTIELNQKIKEVSKYLVDKKYGKEASIIVDGKLKAASDSNILFVYKQQSGAEMFNQNLLELEKFINYFLGNKFNLFALSENDWEIIKKEFNNKEKKYEYEIEPKNILNFLKKKNDVIQDEFSSIIEYN